MALAASVCVDDEALFALARGELGQGDVEVVFAHLKDCADCRAVLAEAARALAPASDSDEASAGERGPTRIARYEIVALLGAGAAGVVYRAFDPQLRRQVALKLLRPELHGQNPEQSGRLLREAQAMARLSDPHVVTVYDVGLHEGRVYLVMEFIDGLTLSEWLRKAPRKREEILKVFADAGAGLVAAHQKGLVHRDFKPENVLVAKTGRASVTDFGLARESESWLGEKAADDRASTELYAPTRGLVGTPAYMAPELFEGATASPASDQFAFCVALYGALFERHPFKAGEGIAMSELITRVRGDAPLEPAFRSAADERLFAVLSRGLSPNPAARFPGLAELLGAVQRAQGQRLGVPSAGWILAGLGGIAAAAATLLLWPRTEPQALPIAPSALPAAESEPPVVAGTVVPASAAPEPSAAAPQSASATPDKERAPGAKPTERRRPPKPSEVRYKDWLKDPF